MVTLSLTVYFGNYVLPNTRSHLFMYHNRLTRFWRRVNDSHYPKHPMNTMNILYRKRTGHYRTKICVIVVWTPPIWSNQATFKHSEVAIIIYTLPSHLIHGITLSIYSNIVVSTPTIPYIWSIGIWTIRLNLTDLATTVPTRLYFCFWAFLIILVSNLMDSIETFTFYTDTSPKPKFSFCYWTA